MLRGIQQHISGNVLATLFTIAPLPVSFAQNVGMVEGMVVDSTSGKPIPHVSVVLKGTFVGAVSDSGGIFLINLPFGNHELKFYHIGYKKAERAFIIDSSQPLQLRISLLRSAVQLGTITVEAEKVDQPAHFHINSLSARNAPALGEPDVMRTLSLLPGIAQINDYKSSLYVRGGDFDQNLLLLDGVEVYNPRHLLGLFSAFNLWALEKIEVYTGNFPVKYGDRLSSVILLNTITPEDTSMTVGNLSLVSSGFSITRKRNNTFLLLSGRRTYLDLVTRAAGQRIPYRFYDLNFKLNQKISPTLDIDLIGFTNVDGMSGESEEETDEEIQPSGNNWGNRLVAIRLNKLGNRSSHTLLASYSQNFIVTKPRGTEVFIDNKLHDFSLKLHSQVSFEVNRVEFGMEYKKLDLDYGWRIEEDLNIETIFYSGIPANYHARSTNHLYNFYVAEQLFLSPTLSLRGAIRYSIIDTLFNGVVSPRISAFWHTNRYLQFNFSLGRYYQFVAEGKEGLEWNIGGPLFVLDLPMNANMYSFGVILRHAWGYSLRAEGYYKAFGKIVKMAEEDTAPFPSFVYGSGNAYGVDCLLEKTEGRLTFQVAYSFLRSKVKFNTVSYTPNWDVPHSLKGIVGMRLGTTWTFNAALTYRSGTVYSPALGRFFGPGGRGEQETSYSNYHYLFEYFIEGNTNSARLPAYSRWDVSLRKQYHNAKFKWILYIQVQNILFSKNALRYDWKEFYNIGNIRDSGVVASLPLIPSIGAEFEF